MADHVAIDRRGRGHEHPDADSLPTAGSAELLPGRRDRARVAGEDGRVEPADVDAELEGVGADHAEDLAVAQPALDRPPFRGQVAAPVAADPRPWTGPFAERLAEAGQEDLDGRPRPAEDDRLAAGPQEGQGPAIGQGQRRAAGAGGRIEQRRLHEEEVALARWGTVPIDQAGRSPGQRPGQLGRVPDRRRAAHDDRVRAVVGAQPEQPPQDVGDVAAEHPAVGVQLVDDDHPELLEQLEPLGVVGQDRGVEHVRVGDHDLAGRPDGRPDRRRRVPVVGGGRDAQVGRPGELGELGHLVLPEGLGGEQEQRPRGRVVGQRLEGRQRVAQRLARCGRGHDDDVLAGADRLDGGGLVDVQLGDAAARQAAHDPRVEPVGQGSGQRRPGRDHLVMDDPTGERRLGEDPVEDRLDGGRRVVAHRRSFRDIEQMYQSARV